MENELVFLGMVGFILVGIVFFIDNLINPHEEVQFFTTLIFFVLGIIVSLLLSVVGLQYLYLLVTIVLIILTYAPGKKFWKKRK